MLDKLRIGLHLLLGRGNRLWNDERLVIRGCLGLLPQDKTTIGSCKKASQTTSRQTVAKQSAIQVETFRNETQEGRADEKLIAHREDFDIAKLHRIGVACKTDMAAGAILARMGRVAHVFTDGGQIGIENTSAVEFDLNL